MGDVATATFDREMASTLEDNSTHVLDAIDAAALASTGDVQRPVRALRPADRPERLESAPVRDSLHRRQAKAGTGIVDPVEAGVPPGSRTDGLAPISVAARSLAARTEHWVGLA